MDNRTAAIATIILVAGASLCLAQNVGLRFCKANGPGFQWFSVLCTSEGYEIHAPSYETIDSKWGRSSRYKKALSRGELPENENYYNVADDLAGFAGAIVFLVGEAPNERGMIPKPVKLGKTWRGRTALECLRAFGKDAGLKVVVPEEGLWIIGPPADVDATAVVVTAYPFDESQATLGSDTLRTVLRTLPVRSWPSYVDGGPQVISLALGYYRIPEEAGRYIFVVSNSFNGGNGAVTGTGPGGMTFKVEIKGDGLNAEVRCQWGIEGIGELVPGFAEDLDGDGTRDFLLLGDERGALKPVLGDYNFVLSGVDGRGLVVFFNGGEIAVKPKADGPKTISVRGLYGSGVEGLDKTVVLNYDEKERKFMPLAQKSRLTPSGEAGEVPRARVSPKEALAALLGGPEQVVEYDESTSEVWRSRREIKAYEDKTGHAFQVQRSLWHLCAWNQGPGLLWQRVLVQGLRAPAEVLIQYIPEGYKRAYFEFSKELDDSVRASDLPQELRPRNVE